MAPAAMSEQEKKLDGPERDGLVGVHKRHVSMLPDAALNADALQTAEVTLRGLQRFWSRTGMILAQRSSLAA